MLLFNFPGKGGADLHLYTGADEKQRVLIEFEVGESFFIPALVYLV